MKDQRLKDILLLLQEQRGFDFSGYRSTMLERRLQKRIYSTNSKNSEEYFTYLNQNSDEFDNLIDVFTINVSSFFRNPLMFEYLRKIVIPDIYSAKAKEGSVNLRIWSAGCSFGEEPYSLAILLNEFYEKEESSVESIIFATDIDKKALKQAAIGRYGFNSIKNIKYGLLQKYFTIDGAYFDIVSQIKKQVNFSLFDILNKNILVPPDSIFGGFDLVLCRNVLIYFEVEYQKMIFHKLYKSLNPNGFLVLGEAEMPIEGFQHKFKRMSNCCKIYRKI